MFKKKLFLLLILFPLFTYGQSDVKLTGQVTDSMGDPVIGATVSIKGTNRGTVTNYDGMYDIIVSRLQVLVFSHIGMEPKEIVYDGQKTLNVTLEENINLLDDVVVIGYQTVKKSDLTGAVAAFNPNSLKNTTVTGTVGDALKGVAGVNVRTSGAPGSEGRVEIRGTGTFGSSTPLYVVDGIISGANRDFNYNDIESIQILKDASAAAIYGSRAGNGVIIITTKQGAQGPMKIDFSSRMTFQWLPRYDLAGRDRWIELNDMAFENAGVPLAHHFDANTNWQNVAFKTGFVQDQNISFRGGDKKSLYFISANYQSNSGATIGTHSERITVRANTSANRNFGDNFVFTVGENAVVSNYFVDELTTNPILDVFRMLPTIPVYNPENEAKGGYGYGSGTRDVTFGVNPVARIHLEDRTNTNLRLRGNAFTELEAYKIIKYRFNFGFDFSSDRYKNMRKQGDWTYNQEYQPSTLTKNQAQYRGFVLDNTIEINKKIGENIISAVIGTSYQTSSYEQIWGTKSNLMHNGNDYLEELEAGMTNSKTSSFKNLEKMFSIFGRLNYNYAEKYLFSFTLRRDESSKFSPSNRTGYFPSFSGGWRISHEDFFNVKGINDLKIRVNYGVLGTSNIGPWDYKSFINFFPQAVFGNDEIQTGMTQVKLANTNLKWEKMAQFNAGIDATALDGKLTLTTDFFVKETRDILTPMQILYITGNSGGNPYVNAASLRNTGVELSVTWRGDVGKDFSYVASLNGSYIKNKILKLGYDMGEFNQWDTKSVVGKSIGEWYLIKTDGIFKSMEEVYAHVDKNGKLIQPDARPGDIRFFDANGDGEINDSDRVHCGSSIPKYEMGANLSATYKNFDMDMQFIGAFGHKVYNGPRSTYDGFADNSGYRANYDAWTPSNVNAKDPRPLYGDSRNARGNTDRWLENGNYVRLKQVSLGYTVPQSFFKNTLSNLRLYVNAENLLTFTKYTGLDPEFRNTNIWDRSYDTGAFPNPRGFTFGAQLSF